MDDHEADLVILRSCLQVLNVRPRDDICPDLEAIARGDGSIEDKIDRLGADLERNIRAKRRPGTA